MSRVSVVVPCYNYARFLRECVESVLSQPGVDVRVLVLDDASTDDTPRVAAALAEQDARVEYRRHLTNRRHIATYNEGLEWATGDYTVLLSADDLLTPGSLARATRLPDAHPEVGFVYGDNIRLVEGVRAREPRTAGADCAWQVSDGLEWLRSVLTERRTFIDSPEVVVRTEMYKRLGGYRPELPHTADVEMWLRLAAHGAVGRVEADQAYYRVHGKNMHADLAPSALRSLEHWHAAFEVFFDECGERVPGAAGLRRDAGRSLAAMALAAAYVPTRIGDRSAHAELIAFAHRVCPDSTSLRGKYRAGFDANKTLAEWARRTLLGVPAYLFRGAIVDATRCARLGLARDAGGMAFMAGRLRAEVGLIGAAFGGRRALR